MRSSTPTTSQTLNIDCICGRADALPQSFVFIIKKTCNAYESVVIYTQLVLSFWQSGFQTHSFLRSFLDC